MALCRGGGGLCALSEVTQEGADSPASRLYGSGYGGHPRTEREREECAEGVHVGRAVMPEQEHFHSVRLVIIGNEHSEVTNATKIL